MKRYLYYLQRNGAKARWRIARVVHRCDRVDYGLRCRNYISPEDRYFDTGELNLKSRDSHATQRICYDCAYKEITI